MGWLRYEKNKVLSFIIVSFLTEVWRRPQRKKPSDISKSSKTKKKRKEKND